ncbi:SPOR domain-containing protein [Candidatus Deferrimicrobium sp.]|uniref:SPOR domain-containing protein n=1 Tax=Candidatus Deferrimicrobium sp. TaxID=3060586 RepID=UPI002715EDA6|nr:SPOR domain-containing protein [Candidatus Deferrimicrobium sp.]MDO8738153.1 SPOR domain-containing protein [Candidatus Deferrimicrobium sp.]
MRSLRHKLGFRRSDPDRHSFAFFVVGILVVIAVAFFLGFQLGRYVEKGAGKESAGKVAPRGPAGKNGARISTSAEIRKDMSAFSEEAVKIPAVAPPAAMPPTAGDDLKKTESEATFPESLSRKDPSPEPMGKKKEKPPVAAPSGEAKFMLQAGAMKTRATADALRRRLDRSGYKTKVFHATTRKQGEVYRVRVGPFGSRDEAMKAMKAIGAEMKIDVILLKG